MTHSSDAQDQPPFVLIRRTASSWFRARLASVNADQRRPVNVTSRNAPHVWHSRRFGSAPGGGLWSPARLAVAGRGAPRGSDRVVISLRRMSLGSGYRYLMESVAVGDGARGQSSNLTRYYAESGTPPGVFLGAGLAGLDGGRGVAVGSPVTEQQLFNLLGMGADPITGEPLGRQPNRSQLSAATRIEQRVEAIPEAATEAQRAELTRRIAAEERAKTLTGRAPVAGFDLTFSPSKSVSVAWALADRETKAVIYECHRQAIDVVIAYAEREVFHSRSGTNGVVQEDIDGVVAAAFTHFDSRAGDPQLHDHVVVANRARSVSDGVWRTLDSRGLFKATVMLSELHQGVLSDLLTEQLGWGWDGRSRRHSDQLRFEVAAVPEALMAEFSRRTAAIEERKNTLITEFVAAHGRQPTNVEVLGLRQRATLQTRPDKTHHSLSELTERWRARAVTHVGRDPAAWVAELAERNDLPLLHASDLADPILADVADVAVQKVAERRATFSRANLVAEVHRQLHGVRFASADERIAVAERSADLAVSRSLLISAPELHTTPERLRRGDGTSRFRGKGYEVYTTASLLEAEARLLDAGRRTTGPAVTMATIAAITEGNVAGRDHRLSLDQALAIEQVAGSGRSVDVLVGPAGSGKSTTMAGLRAVWEAEHGPGSVLGLAPSAAAAEVLAAELGIDTENTAKWLYEHHQEPERQGKIAQLRRVVVDPRTSPLRRSALRSQVASLEAEVAAWRLSAGQLVIVDEASLAGTFALDELVTAAIKVGAKVLLVGDGAQLSSVEAGGMFAALVSDRDGSVPALNDVLRFREAWEKAASIELRAGSDDAIDAYLTHDRVDEGNRDGMLDALYRGWKDDTNAGLTSLMIAGDPGTVNELNARARAERIAAGAVNERGVRVVGGATAGVGDRVVTRQNDRRLTTGLRWVRNGDQWTVTATHDDGSMTVARLHGVGKVVLPACYVAEHVDLAYASTAHRSQGRTVDTGHAMVSPTTTREVLYVSATRGRGSNRLYVDTHYDPDPQTGHDAMTEPVTAREVLAGVLRREGADVAAHEVIRRAHDEAEGMERLSAEYLTLATLAQAERFDALLARSGLTTDELASVQASEARGPLFAAFRDAEARGLNIDVAFPHLVAGRSLADADDVAAVLHHRVERWAALAAGGHRRPGNLIAGLIPRAQGVTDPELATALAERDRAMEARARTLAAQAVEAGEGWVAALGTPPGDPIRLERWLREVSTVAAYRDRWHSTSGSPCGARGDVASIEQTVQYRRGQAALRRAKALGLAGMTDAANPIVEVQVRVQKGVER
jgi:conjugative relaxase-like TrwC/TraI family protein